MSASVVMSAAPAGEPISPDSEARLQCSRCGTRATTFTPTREVVSPNFTGFDGWVNPRGPGLCATCTWAYSDPALRQLPHRVDVSRPGARPLSKDEVRQTLSAGPLPTTASLVVPIRPGRKHLLPLAEWGRVTTDHATISWTSNDAELLRIHRCLLKAGFATSDLDAPAPPFATLRQLPRSLWASTIAYWARLDPWRPDTPWLLLANAINR